MIQTLCIIQARMGSTRFPGKVLMPIKGKPMIVHMIDRLKRCRLIDQIVIATSNSPQDAGLLQTARDQGVHAFAGSENDVLDRYYQAALRYPAKNVVRCTGDCPVIDPAVTDRVIRSHFVTQSDYTSNTLERTFPRGLDTEVFTFKTLERAAKEATKPYEREHVTPYIFEHPEFFAIEQVLAEPVSRQPELRLTVDTAEDFSLIQEIFTHLYENNPMFLVDEILDLLRKHPELRQLNAGIKQKSMA